MLVKLFSHTARWWLMVVVASSPPDDDDDDDGDDDDNTENSNNNNATHASRRHPYAGVLNVSVNLQQSKIKEICIL